MPTQTFEITRNGQTLQISGDRIPTEQELNDIFAQAFPAPEEAAIQGALAPQPLQHQPDTAQEVFDQRFAPPPVEEPVAPQGDVTSQLLADEQLFPPVERPTTLPGGFFSQERQAELEEQSIRGETPSIFDPIVRQRAAEATRKFFEPIFFRTGRDIPTMREYLTNVFLIALAIAFLAHFALIVKYGGYFIQEPNSAILISEIVLLIGIVVFGILNLIKVIRQRG